jgi:hypothetical protein
MKAPASVSEGSGLRTPDPVELYSMIHRTRIFASDCANFSGALCEAMSKRDGIRRECAWSLDVFLCVFQSPEGRTENSPGLQPWERHAQGNRPERASDRHSAALSGRFSRGRLPRAEAHGLFCGPVSNLGNTFVSKLGDSPERKNPLGVSEKG